MFNIDINNVFTNSPINVFFLCHPKRDRLRTFYSTPSSSSYHFLQFYLKEPSCYNSMKDLQVAFTVSGMSTLGWNECYCPHTHAHVISPSAEVLTGCFATVERPLPFALEPPYLPQE